MSVWKPNINRRKEPRFRVGWTATLTCYSADTEESIEAKVTEISINGARLQLKTLKIGRHHLVVGGDAIRLTLRVTLQQIAFCAPVAVVWYSAGREKESFDLGVKFLFTADEGRAAIEKLLADVALESANRQ